jgi:hypothetical protein
MSAKKDTKGKGKANEEKTGQEETQKTHEKEVKMTTGQSTNTNTPATAGNANPAEASDQSPASITGNQAAEAPVEKKVKPRRADRIVKLALSSSITEEQFTKQSLPLGAVHIGAETIALPETYAGQLAGFELSAAQAHILRGQYGFEVYKEKVEKG